MTQFIKVENIFSFQMGAELDWFGKMFRVHLLLRMTEAEVEESKLRLKETNLLCTIPQGIEEEESIYFQLQPIPQGKISFQKGNNFEEMLIEGQNPENCFNRFFDLLEVHLVCKIEVTQEDLNVIYYLRKDGKRLERFLYEAKLMN